jgi:hypothetical protein
MPRIAPLPVIKDTQMPQPSVVELKVLFSEGNA